MSTTDAHHATIRAALEHRRIALVVELANWFEGHPMRVKYQVEIAAVNAALAYLDTLAAGQYQPNTVTGWPHSEGYYAFEGRVLGSSVENLRWVVMVRMNKIDSQYYAYRFGGHTHKVTDMIGAWTKLHVPWDAPQNNKEDGDGSQ